MTSMLDRPTTRLAQDEHEDRSLGEVLSDLATHSHALLRGELLRFKREAAQSAKVHAMGAAYAVAAAVLALVAVIFAGHTIAQAVNLALPQWAAYLITTVLYLAGAALLGLKAKAAFTARPLMPTETIDKAQEDLQWIQANK